MQAGTPEPESEPTVVLPPPREPHPGSRAEPIMAYVRQQFSASRPSVRGAEVADALGATEAADRKNIAQALARLVATGHLRRVARGTYALPLSSPSPRKAKAAAPVAEPTDRYSVVDAVLESLFPKGISVKHLSEIVAWRDATAELLRLANPEEK